MARIDKFEDIIAWQKAMQLCDLIYSCTNKEKFSKDFGLKDQIRRSSVSVVSNIAEGFEREGNNQFIYFLTIAKGSAGELRAQIYIAKNQEYITPEEFESLNNKVIEVSKTISGFVAYLKGLRAAPKLSN
jgi:four helix bundle protein